MKTVAIIEDVLEIRQGLVSIIASDKRFALAGAFESAEEALVSLSGNPPAMILADINLPGMSGVDFIRKYSAHRLHTQIVMFTIYEDNAQIFEALKAGACGYLLKNTLPPKILDALAEVSEGGSPMSPAIARKVLQSFMVPDHQADNYALLSLREKEVLQLLSKGFLYKEIAHKLSMSLNTVKRHCSSIYEKLQVNNRTEAINKTIGK